jgi:CTP synthase
MKLYDKKLISERHRHRLEINDKYLQDFEKVGFNVSGINPETGLVEIMELSNHPFFIGVQAHPEYKSRLTNPSPLFLGLIKASLAYKES